MNPAAGTDNAGWADGTRVIYRGLTHTGQQVGTVTDGTVTDVNRTDIARVEDSR